MRQRSILGLICLLAACPAMAQTDSAQTSDTTLIYGSVPSVCTVETASPLAIVQLSPALQDVTNVVYTCNSPNGFARRISSQNGGALVRGTQAVNYLLSQGGTGALAFTSLNLQTVHSDDVAAFEELAIGSSGMLRLEIPAIPPQLLAGDYVDTVTIEITPN